MNKYDRIVEMVFLQLIELVPESQYKTLNKRGEFGTMKYEHYFYLVTF